MGGNQQMMKYHKEKQRRVWSKVQKDLVLNLGELAIASGYDRAALSRMKLPLQSGKISLSDFKRILHGRQDALENPVRQSAPDRPTKAEPSNPSENGWAERLFYGRSGISATSKGRQSANDA
jgi:hypothetical protein